MTTIPVLVFDALQQLQCFTLRNCPGFGYNWDPKAMHRYTAPFEFAPHLRFGINAYFEAVAQFSLFVHWIAVAVGR